MQIKNKLTLIVLALLLVTTNISAQLPQAPQALKPTATKLSEPKVEVRSAFADNVIKSAIAGVKNGTVERKDLRRLRFAMLAPSFQKRAEDLAVLQMAASGEDGPFETSDTGEIIRETINWEGLAAFLEKLIPLILQLLAAFGM